MISILSLDKEVINITIQIQEKYGSFEEIFPPLSLKSIKMFLKEYDPEMVDKITDLKEIPLNIKNLLERVFVTKELKVKGAVKARFYQFLEKSYEFKEFEIIDENVNADKIHIDLILDNAGKDLIYWVLFEEYGDSRSIKHLIDNIDETVALIEQVRSKKKKKDPLYKIDIPDKIIIVFAKLNRDAASLGKEIYIDSGKIPVELWLEYEDLEKPFDDWDVIIIDDLNIKGFNFGSLDEILSLIKRTRGKGYYTVFRERPNGLKEIIWQGIIFPKEVLKGKE